MEVLISFDGPLFVGRIAFLHHCGDGTLGITYHPAVAGRIVQPRM